MCGLLLLEIGLILQCLLLIRGHVWLLRLLIAWHALWWHVGGHRRRRGMLLFGRLDG